MSVKSSVVRIESGTATPGFPDTNASNASAAASSYGPSPTPPSSLIVACGIRSATKRASSADPARCSTRVGTLIEPRTSVISVSTPIRIKSAAAAGLALSRASRRTTRNHPRPRADEDQQRPPPPPNTSVRPNARGRDAPSPARHPPRSQMDKRRIGSAARRARTTPNVRNAPGTSPRTTHIHSRSHRHRTTSRVQALRVKHRRDVVHTRLERHVTRPVRQTRATRIKNNQPGSCRHPRQEPRRVSPIPEHIKVRQMRRVDNRLIRIPDHLISNRDIAAPGIPDLRRRHNKRLSQPNHDPTHPPNRIDPD